MRGVQMNQRRYALTIIMSGLLAFGAAGAERGRNGAGTKGTGLQKTTGSPSYTWLNINKISTVLRNNGTADIDVTQNNSGLIYPKGSNKTAIYLNGILWAARVAGDPQVRVGGSAFTSGLQPGKLLSPGVAEEEPDLPRPARLPERRSLLGGV
jgi:hypothetical protein